MKPYELPPDFLKAREKHRLPDPFRTANAIWVALRAWRKGEVSTFWPRLEDFESELLYAIKSENLEFNEQLATARKSGDQPPEQRITAHQTGVEAFTMLFDAEQIELIRANWPTKQAVVQTATLILRQAGQPGHSKRHWSRVLKEIGLSALPEAPERRPRKLVT